MPEYRIRETGEIVTDLKAAFPNVSLPVSMAPDDYDAIGADPVFPVPAPEVGQLEVAVRDGVEQDAKGNWVERWVVRPMFSEYTDEDGVVHTQEEQEAAYLGRKNEEQWNAIRAERNTKLAECDWTQLPDTPLTESEKIEWAAYRQALRDITEQSDPFNITWPTKPGV